MPHSLFELNNMSEQELRNLADSLGIKGTKKMDKASLGFSILDQEALLEAQKPTPSPKPAAKKRGRPKKEEKKPEDTPKKETPKQEVKKEEKKPATKKAEKVDYSKMTVAELKEVAKKKDIKVPAGAKKADIIELLK